MRVVVFGAGYWGTNYVRELGHHCIGVVDPDEEALVVTSQRFGVNTYAHSPPEPFDGAIIATPPNTHYELAMPLLQAGKLVLIEKPMAMSLARATQLASFDNCMAGLVYLYHPEVERLRDLCTEWQHYDRLSHVFSRRTNEGPVRPYGDAMWDLAPHDISIFNCLFGGPPVAAVKALSERDWAVIQLQYAYGTREYTALSYVSWHGSPKERLVELVPKMGQREIFNDLNIVLEKPPLTCMVEAFLAGDTSRSTGQMGADVVKVLEACS